MEMVESETVVVANKKVRNYIPHDITLCILSKLCLKSLKRFECACKSWSLLLQNSHFMTMLNNYSMSISKDYDDTYFILQYVNGENTIPSEFYLLHDNVFQNRVKIDWPRPFRQYNENIYILGSVSINGIFCLKQNYNGRRPVLWNPTTGASKVIPRTRVKPGTPPPRYVIHGFGYDSLTDDYKVVQLIDYYFINNKNKSSHPGSWELYSLRNNSWKKLDVSVPKCYYCALARSIGVYVNGVSHWWARTETEYLFDVEECLVSFDFSNEVFFTTPPPLYLDVSPRPSCEKHVEERVEKHLVLLNESIALISTYKMTSTFHISVLGELGVGESWTKLYVINHLRFIEYPIGVGIKNNVVFFKKMDGKLACIDLNTKMIEEDLGVYAWDYGCQIGKYKKSTLPIGGMHN